MNINKNIDYQYEAINLIYRIYSETDLDGEVVKKLLEKGIPQNLINKVMQGYMDLKGAVKTECKKIDKTYLEYFLMTINDSTSIFGEFYIDYITRKEKPYNEIFDLFLVESVEEEYVSELKPNEAVNIINDLPINDNYKLTLINFYLGGIKLFNSLMEIVEVYANSIKKNYHYVSSEINYLIDEIQNNPSLINFINEYFNFDKLYFEINEVKIMISLYNTISARVINDNKVLRIGFLSFALKDLINQNEIEDSQILSTLKTISDPTRAKILKLIKDHPTYANDLAKVIELTPATVNHHLNMLVQNKLIKITINQEDKKKIYYQLNKQGIEDLLDSIKKALL